jgi:Putative translation initiation inhibitor, yjgF family
MSRQIINTEHAPAAIGPYSQAVRVGNVVYFSGQIPLDPATGNVVEGDITAQARRALTTSRRWPRPPVARWSRSCAAACS